MDFLQNHIEALIFASPEALRADDIARCLKEMYDAEIPENDIDAALAALEKKYAGEEFPFEICRIAGGYQFLTKPAYHNILSILLKQSSKKRLSASAMETLSIIAYKQPISKSELEMIRGVSCDYAVQRLLEKGLIEIKGKSEAVGRPLLYGTNSKFMEYFGINELKDLPQPKDIAGPENEIGIPEE